LMTYPGVPCIYYGDEIGLEGGPDPDNRRCMSWDEHNWDTDLRVYCQKLISLRRTAPALQYGGYQDLYAEGGVIAFQRQSAKQRLIVIGCRGPEEIAGVAIPAWQGGLRDGTRLVDRLSGAEHFVEDGAIHPGTLTRGAALMLEEINS